MVQEQDPAPPPEALLLLSSVQASTATQLMPACYSGLPSRLDQWSCRKDV